LVLAEDLEGDMQMHRSNFLLLCAFLWLYVVSHSWAQDSKAVYESIRENPSKIRWCLPAAGNDPADIIEHACHVYVECLATVKLDVDIDRPPFPRLAQEQSEELRRCHQALFNAAIVNPQLKGSKATQKWLLKEVLPGTEAKPFPVPDSWAPR
jgi:hypothetical protein